MMGMPPMSPTMGPAGYGAPGMMAPVAAEVPYQPKRGKK